MREAPTTVRLWAVKSAKTGVLVVRQSIRVEDRHAVGVNGQLAVELAPLLMLWRMKNSLGHFSRRKL
jgi:hypothetical protein